MQKNDNVGERLNFTTLLGLSAPALPLAALTLPLTTFVPEYYTHALGMQLSVVGLIFMIVRLLDIGLDPLLGGWMDRTRSRWGRFRPWMFIGMPMVMGGSALLFFAQPGVGPLYLLAALLLTYAGYSVVTLAQLALSSAMTTSYQNRAKVFTWWQVVTTLGIILVLILPPALNVRTEHMVPVMGWSIVITAPICVLLCLFLVKDRHQPLERPHAGLRAYFRMLRRPSAFKVIISHWMIGMAGGVTAACGIFFLTAVKKITLADFAQMTLVLFIAGVLSAPLWSALAQRIGKHNGFMLAAACQLVFLASTYFLPVGQVMPILVAAVLGGLGYSGGSLLPPAMLADVADEEELETGIDRTGLLFALMTGIFKIGQAVSVGLVFGLLDLIGFDPKLGSANSAGSLNAVALIYSFASAAFALAAIVIIAGYRLTAARSAEVRAALDAQRAAARATASSDHRGIEADAVRAEFHP